jgi:hypothetical protein
MFALARLVCCLSIVFLASGCTLVQVVLPGDGPPGQLEYAGPTDLTIPRGELLPGTNIQYVGPASDGARVLIGGQEAIKKVGDSLDWQGTIAPNASVVLYQRVLHMNDERLLTGGTVTLKVDGATPAAGPYPDKPLQSFRVPVVYNVRRGAMIPGTTIGYAGAEDEGAELSGVSGYPYRKFGDSISWRGQLRSNVFLDITLRVVAYEENSLQVTGLATVALVGE